MISHHYSGLIAVTNVQVHKMHFRGAQDWNSLLCNLSSSSGFRTTLCGRKVLHGRLLGF